MDDRVERQGERRFHVAALDADFGGLSGNPRVADGLKDIDGRDEGIARDRPALCEASPGVRWLG
jgi:hypothetical protein